MGKTNHADHLTLGNVVLDRLAGMTVPAALKPHVVEFKQEHGSLVAASNAAESARSDRDAALVAVSAADASLDAAVNALADTLVGAQLGDRKNAFKSFSKHAPFAVTKLPYAVEAKEVLSITAKVKKAAKGNAGVLKAAATCEKLSAGVTTALSKLTKPQLAYAKALASRDGLLPAWTKSLDQLKKNAAAVWFTDPATYKAVFAPPEKVQAPVHARKKKAAKKAKGPGTPPTPTTPSKPA
jgi:hypothetical protein